MQAHVEYREKIYSTSVSLQLSCIFEADVLYYLMQQYAELEQRKFEQWVRTGYDIGRAI